MTYSNVWLQGELEKGIRHKYLYFWGHTAKAKGVVDQSCLSQWWPCAFEDENEKYLSAEHYMMAEKARLFKDQATRKKILAANSPALAKKLGREVQHFDQNLWEEKRFEIVRQGNLLKFGQNEALKTFLLNTKNRVLVEASPVDVLWGIGLAKDNPTAQNPFQWKGLNLLGFALMEVRDLLRK